MQINYTAKDLERFWSKVLIPQNENDCWVWQASTVSMGYGHVSWCGKIQYANRVSWMLFFGGIPKGFFVCHKCDNPPCVNPLHLFLGTKKDNHDDMVKKGRRASFRGEKNGRCKVNDSQVYEIRKIYAEEKLGSSAIAEAFGIHRCQVWRIVNHKERS